MFIYFLIFPIIGLIYLAFHNPIIKNRKLFLICSFSFLAVIASLRANTVGSDVANYQNIFESTINGYTPDTRYPVYVTYSHIVGLVSQNPYAITIANSLVICSLIGIFIYRSGVHSLYSTFLFVGMYFYGDSLNGARQYIAVGLIANAFLFILNKKWMQYILLTVLAIGIHSTAILSLIFIPIVVVKWTRKNIFMFFVIIIVISLLYNRIISLFYIIFPQYSIYSNQQFLSTIPTQGTGMIVIYYLFLLCLFLVFLYVINSYNLQLTSVEIKIILSYSISLLLSIIFFKNVLMIRMLWYFSILGIICFPIIIDKVSALFKKDKQARVVIFSLFFVIIFFAYVIQLKKGIDEIVPYITWL